MKTLEDITFTHWLLCSHCVGRGRSYYHMPCLVLKAMDDGRVKIKVFGDRDWKDTYHKERIRYVQANRVTAREVSYAG